MTNESDRLRRDNLQRDKFIILLFGLTLTFILLGFALHWFDWIFPVFAFIMQLIWIIIIILIIVVVLYLIFRIIIAVTQEKNGIKEIVFDRIKNLKKIFTLPWIGVLILDVLLLIAEFLVIIPGFVYGVNMSIFFTILIICSIALPMFLKEPYISPRNGFYIFIAVVAWIVISNILSMTFGGIWYQWVLLAVAFLFYLYFSSSSSSNGSRIQRSDTIKSDDSRYVSSEVRQAVWSRDHGRCVICGSRRKLHYDHIIPFRRGGSNSEKNIRILCEKCNLRKSDKIE
jgi:hypothetical protein